MFVAQVAQIQLKVFEQISQKDIASVKKDPALVELNSKLLDVSAVCSLFVKFIEDNQFETVYGGL